MNEPIKIEFELPDTTIELQFMSLLSQALAQYMTVLNESEIDGAVIWFQAHANDAINKSD